MPYITFVTALATLLSGWLGVWPNYRVASSQADLNVAELAKLQAEIAAMRPDFSVQYVSLEALANAVTTSEPALPDAALQFYQAPRIAIDGESQLSDPEPVSLDALLEKLRSIPACAESSRGPSAVACNDDLEEALAYEVASARARGIASEAMLEPAVQYLAVMNVGKGRARDVFLSVSRREIAVATEIFYVTDVGEMIEEGVEDSIQVGELDTGETVLVPLYAFITAGEPRMDIATGTMFAPRVIEYRALGDVEPSQVDVRSMLKDSVAVGAYVRIRG